MNNKPVAWMGLTAHNQNRVSIEKLANDDRPLYTHPANACKHGVDDGACKECYLESTHPAGLTDEEINDIAQECWVYPKGEQAIFNQHKFARAILRKAQEK